jgi:hypothetical protein
MTDIEVPVQSDPSTIQQIGVDYLQSVYPLWTPNPASYDVRELGAHAAMISEFIKVAVQIPEDALTQIVGTVIYQTPRQPALAAAVLSRWETTDTAEHTIPAGVNVTLTASDGTAVGFQTTADVTKAAGGHVFEHVPLLAVEPGAVANGLKGPATLIDSLISDGAAWVQSIELEEETAGGVDEESSAQYTQRIVELARILAPRIVRPEDYATAARLFVPGIARALAIDEFNPETGKTDAERCIAVAAIMANGQPATGPQKAQLLAVYERLRERSFQPFVIDPTYTAINVDFAGVATAGETPADVEARAEAAVATFISPAFYGMPDTGDTTSWEDRPILRFQDVVTVLNNVDGFDHYTALTLNGGGADVALAGPAALPEVGAITGAVVAP